MSKIAVFGSFILDNVAYMDRFPAPGETIIGKELKLFPGGKGANQCIALARQGNDVVMLGMVGNDSNGEMFRDLFKSEGIDDKCIFVSKDKLTGCAQIQINKESQNRICVLPNANHDFLDGEFEKCKEVIKSSSMLICQLEMRIDITAKMIKFAHENGIKVILNPAPAIKLDDELLSCVDYLIPNETELAILSDCPTDSVEEAILASKKLMEKNVKNLIVTLGSKGALLVNDKGSYLISSYHVKAVDTVAAGDSFIGAFASALDRGLDEIDAIKYANAMGALTVQVPGAIPSLHRRDEVEKFIKENEELKVERI